MLLWCWCCVVFIKASLLTVAHSVPWNDNNLQQHVLSNSNTLNSKEFNKLVTVSKLVDITYCISSVTHIQKPFRCASNCDEFPNMELVYQWTSTIDLDEDKLGSGDRAVITGYISIDHSINTWYIGLRGTRSATDAIADIKIDQVHYPWLNCSDCYVHNGFYKIFENTLVEIEMIVHLLILDYPHYKIMLMGHSMGAAVSNLLALYLKDVYGGGVDDSNDFLHLDCITFGQPKLGNTELANLVNKVFNLTNVSYHPDEYYNGSESETQRMKLYRVTNIGDPVVQLPYSLPDPDDEENGIEYVHSKGELCIMKMSTELDGDDVAICSSLCPDGTQGCTDPRCKKKVEPWGSNAHLMYFKILGACNFGFF